MVGFEAAAQKQFISVIIPVFWGVKPQTNGDIWIYETLDGIADQKYPGDMEIISVSDGPLTGIDADIFQGLKEKYAGLPLQLYSTPSWAGNPNPAIEFAKTKMNPNSKLAHAVDDDDREPKGVYTKSIASYIESKSIDPEVIAVYGGTIRMTETGNLYALSPAPPYDRDSYTYKNFVPSNIFVESEVFVNTPAWMKAHVNNDNKAFSKWLRQYPLTSIGKFALIEERDQKIVTQWNVDCEHLSPHSFLTLFYRMQEDGLSGQKQMMEDDKISTAYQIHYSKFNNKPQIVTIELIKNVDILMPADYWNADRLKGKVLH